MDAWLENATGERLPLGPSCSLGRAGTNQVVLADARVSRRHALIQMQGDAEFWLVDFGSANGTHLNGLRVASPMRLRDGDRMEVAGIPFVFHQTGSVGDAEWATRTVTTQHEVRSFDSWLLLTDIIDSTRLVQAATPEELPVTVGRWFAACREIVEGTGGQVYQFLGDGLMVYWTDAAWVAAQVRQALGKFLELQRAKSVDFRLVLHFGRVATGGFMTGREASLMGSDMHYTFRMEKLAAQLKARVLMSEPAAQRLEGAPVLTAVGQHPLSGFGGVHSFYTLPEDGA